MFTAQAAFSGFSVDDLDKARTFYTETLGLKLEDEMMGLRLGLPGGGSVFIYPKPSHEAATFTVLNLVVGDIDKAVDELTGQGVVFEHYDDEDMKTDEKGVARGAAVGRGPNIAWFKDPAGNILSVIEADA